MRLYDNATGGNVRRVLIYLAEKGLTLERVHIDLTKGEQKTPAFLAKNPAGLVPLLELDDGGFLPESSAIIEYLEEKYPEPPLLGASPEARGRVRALERISNDLALYGLIYYEHSHAFFAARLKQDPDVAQAMLPRVTNQLNVLEAHIGENDFLAGDAVTIADCSLFPLFQTCRTVLKDESFAATQPKLNQWYKRFETRPSAAY